MKKILLAAALFAAMNTTAQTVKEDTVEHYTYASIQPVTVYPNKATRLRLQLAADNLEKSTSQAVFRWTLLDESSKALATGDYTIEKADYENWNANSLEDTYLMVALKLKLTIVD